MAGSRGPTPLFEVLAGHGENRPPASPREAPRRGPDEGPRERPEAGGGGAGGNGGASRLSVPLPTVYASFAVVLLLCLLCFLVGYQSGYGRAEGELAGLGPMEVVPLDPLAEDGGMELPAPLRPRTGGNAGGNDGSRPAGGSGGAPAGGGTPSAGDPGANWVLGLDGARMADPRIEGNNYLELVTLSQAQAEEAIAYLAGNEVAAIGVPVDRGARGSNNPARYRVVTLELAIPSGRFSALDGDRRRLEQRLRDLGRAWVSEGGWSDFRDPLWRRYDP